MLAVLCGVLALSSPILVQTDQTPAIALPNGGAVKVKSVVFGTSDDVDELKNSKADVIIIRLSSFSGKTRELVSSLQKGPNGRRGVLLDFPLFAANPKNGFLWQKDWDMNSDGKPDEDAPGWLMPRNSSGDYPFKSSDEGLRSSMLGKNGFITRAASAGFDGIMVSGVSYDKSRSSLDAKLLADATIEGRKRRSGFTVLLRNPGKMFDFPVVRFFIDGIVIDGVPYGQERPGQASDAAYTKDSLSQLTYIAKRLRIAIGISYTSDAKQISDFREEAAKVGVIPVFLPKRI